MTQAELDAMESATEKIERMKRIIEKLLGMFRTTANECTCALEWSSDEVATIFDAQAELLADFTPTPAA